MGRAAIVLVAHANEPLRTRVVAELDRAGLAVQATEGGLQALDIARQVSPELACLGPLLHEMAPLDLCKSLANKGIPVMVWGDDVITRDAALRAGATDYVPAAFAADAARVALLLARREKEGASGASIARLTLSEIGALGLVRALVALGRSAIVSLARGEHVAELRFWEGELTSAELDGALGNAAVHRALLWDQALVEVRFVPVVRRQQLGVTMEELLGECERFLRDVEHTARPLGSLDVVLEQDLARAAQVLARIPNEVSSLLRLFDGVRSLAEIVHDSPFRPFDTVRVAVRLHARGVLRRLEESGATHAPAPSRRERFKTPPPVTLALSDWLTREPTAPGQRRATPAFGTPVPVSPRVSEPLREGGASAPTAGTGAAIESPIAGMPVESPLPPLSARIDAALERQRSASPVSGFDSTVAPEPAPRLPTLALVFEATPGEGAADPPEAAFVAPQPIPPVSAAGLARSSVASGVNVTPPVADPPPAIPPSPISEPPPPERAPTPVGDPPRGDPAPPSHGPPPAEPRSRATLGHTTFTALEEEFFAKVDEHGRLPHAHEGPDDFRDLETDGGGLRRK